MLNFPTHSHAWRISVMRGWQNKHLPKLAALCAAAAIAVLSACAQPPQSTPSPTATIVQPTPTAPQSPIPIPANVAFTQISAGKTHACALRENGAIACWGEDPDRAGSLNPPTNAAFTQISAGLHFACALRQDAAIACWGNNSHGQATPPQGSFAEISAGRHHACAIPTPQDAPFQLSCWGLQFPNGAETIPLDTPISDIQSGADFTCGLTPEADIACLSTETRLIEITPGPFTRLGVGLHHICALRQDASAFCKSDSNHLHQATPSPAKFIQIAAGWNHSCGITQSLALECWGSGVRGAPGERLAAPAGEFAAIAIGWRNSCALAPNGSAACWHTPDYLAPSILDPETANLPRGVSLAFGGAKFNSPVDIFPWQNGGLAIVERQGVIALHHDRPDAPPPQTILDLTDAVVCCPVESGMLSAAPDPQFQDFPFLYVWYRTLAHNAQGDAAPAYVGRLSRFRIENNAALKNSELPILEIPLPAHNHLGGAVRFGADGMLYLGIGDNVPQRSPQALDNLEGKIIRIDIRGAHTDKPYRVPPDNPFADAPGARPEIWAYGLRNPWRMAFHPADPASLFVADVGDSSSEEVSIAVAAANLGYPLCEGNACRQDANPADLTPPAVAYDRDIGCAIIGGVTVPWLDDQFIFGDLCSRRVWTLAADPASGWQMRQIADLSDLARNILAFGAGADGDVYILSYDNPILRLDPSLADALPDE